MPCISAHVKYLIYKNKVLKTHYSRPIKKPTHDYNKCTTLVQDVIVGKGQGVLETL